MYSYALIETLQDHTHIECVWIDDKGNYYLSERVGCTLHTRSQILGTEDTEDIQDAGAETGNSVEVSAPGAASESGEVEAEDAEDKA